MQRKAALDYCQPHLIRWPLRCRVGYAALRFYSHPWHAAFRSNNVDCSSPRIPLSFQIGIGCICVNFSFSTLLSCSSIGFSRTGVCGSFSLLLLLLLRGEGGRLPLLFRPCPLTSQRAFHHGEAETRAARRSCAATTSGFGCTTSLSLLQRARASGTGKQRPSKPETTALSKGKSMLWRLTAGLVFRTRPLTPTRGMPDSSDKRAALRARLPATVVPESDGDRPDVSG